jgi:hypothetical protein
VVWVDGIVAGYAQNHDGCERQAGPLSIHNGQMITQPTANAL